MHKHHEGRNPWKIYKVWFVKTESQQEDGKMSHLPTQLIQEKQSFRVFNLKHTEVWDWGIDIFIWYKK